MQNTETAQGNEKETIRKSVALDATEKQSLRKFIRGFGTITEAAEAIGVSRQVLDRIKIVGSASQQNISIVREKLKLVS